VRAIATGRAEIVLEPKLDEILESTGRGGRGAQ
jgi:hypothetical protein